MSLSSAARRWDRPLQLLLRGRQDPPVGICERDLLKGLVALGHQVSLLCYAHGDEDVVWNEPDIEIHRIQQISDYENLRAGPDLMKPILDALLTIKMMKLQPDIIHVHNYEAPLVSAIGRYHRKIPMVYSAHNTMCEELPTYFSLSFLLPSR